MKNILIAIAVVGSALCLACLVAGGKADDAADHQFEEYKKQRTARLNKARAAGKGGDSL